MPGAAAIHYDAGRGRERVPSGRIAAISEDALSHGGKGAALAVIPARGEVAYLCPAFEEARLRGQLAVGGDVRVWEEDENPYALAKGGLVARVFIFAGEPSGFLCPSNVTCA